MPTTQLASTSIAILGDPHSTPALPGLICRAAAAGASAAFILGDIELRDSAWGDKRLFKLDAAAVDADITTYLLLGNHDDYSFADRRLRPDPSCAEMPPAHPLTERVLLLPHRAPSILTAATPSGEHRRILNVPGAADFWRSAVENWKTESTMPPPLTTTFISELAAQPVDVMLSHDAPISLQTPAVAKIRARPARRLDASTREQVHESAERVDAHFRHARPALTVHGHFHVPDEHTTAANRIISLARAGQPGGAILLDLTTLTVRPLR